MSPRKYVPWIAVAVGALFLAGVAAWRYLEPPKPCCAQAPAATGVGGAFQLVNQFGAPVGQSILHGKWTAVYFGYTFCPDVCPTTLQTLGAAQRRLGAAAKNFQVVFITVDPARDTPKALKAYLSSAAFPPGAIGLTGADEQIAAVAKVYGVYYQKEGEGSSYAVDHSSAIYLMNPQGQFDSVIPYGATPAETRDDILKAMRQAPA